MRIKTVERRGFDLIILSRDRALKGPRFIPAFVKEGVEFEGVGRGET